MKVCENEFVIFSLAVPRSRTGNYWTMNGPLDYGPFLSEEKFVKRRSVVVLIMTTFENHERAYLAVNGKHSSG